VVVATVNKGPSICARIATSSLPRSSNAAMADTWETSGRDLGGETAGGRYDADTHETSSRQLRQITRPCRRASVPNQILFSQANFIETTRSQCRARCLVEAALPSTRGSPFYSIGATTAISPH